MCKRICWNTTHPFAWTRVRRSCRSLGSLTDRWNECFINRGCSEGLPWVTIYSKDGRTFCPRQKNRRQRRGIPSCNFIVRRWLENCFCWLCMDTILWNCNQCLWLNKIKRASECPGVLSFWEGWITVYVEPPKRRNFLCVIFYYVRGKTTKMLWSLVILCRSRYFQETLFT